MSSQHEEFIPGGYPVTPKHEKPENDMGKNNIENNVGNINAENTENGAENSNIENNVGNINAENTENSAENSNIENKAENKDVENKGNKTAEVKNAENDAVESFSLKFKPNPSMKPTDDNNITKATTNKGSSALGDVGVNPAALLGLEPDSPRHPYYQNKSQESDESQPQAFDLNGDYNEQKEKEQIADQQEQDKLDHKPSEIHQKKSEDKKDERIDFGVKPLGNIPIPLPYKPEEGDEAKAPTGNTNRSTHKQTEGTKREVIPPNKTTAVHPESQIDSPKVTKKDKINATLSKAVGTIKEKVGKLVKNDNLATKGTEMKVEADKTKELAEVQQKMNEF